MRKIFGKAKILLIGLPVKRLLALSIKGCPHYRGRLFRLSEKRAACAAHKGLLALPVKGCSGCPAKRLSGRRKTRK